MGRRKVPLLFELRDNLQGHFRPRFRSAHPVQQMVQEFEEPLTPGLHIFVTFLGCRTQIGLLLFMQGRGLDHHLDAINQGAVGNHRGHHRLIVCHASLDVIPAFFHPPDVGAALMMGIGPIEAEYLAAPSLMLGGHESPVAGSGRSLSQPASKTAACIARRLGWAPPGPDLGIVDRLQYLIRIEDQACHVSLNMLKALCPAEHLTIWGRPVMNRGGRPYDRRVFVLILSRVYLLIDSLFIESRRSPLWEQ